MRRQFALLLTFMLALASLASAAHAMPHGPMGDEAIEDGMSRASTHASVPGELAASCCTGEVQWSGPSCTMFLAVLPTGTPMPRPMVSSVSIAMLDPAQDGLGPERLLDPPRP